MFFIKQKKSLVEPSIKAMAKRLNAPITQTLTGINSMNGVKACSVISSALRDKRDISHHDLRKLAQKPEAVINGAGCLAHTC